MYHWFVELGYIQLRHTQKSRCQNFSSLGSCHIWRQHVFGSFWPPPCQQMSALVLTPTPRLFPPLARLAFVDRFFLRAYFWKNVKFSQRNILANQRTLLALFFFRSGQKWAKKIENINLRQRKILALF